MKPFKNISFFWLILIPLVLPGIIVASMRCTLRTLAEQRNVFVETVVDLDEFRQLAREDGWSLEELFKELKENGASSVSISEDTLASLELEGKITVLSTKEIRKLSLEESYEIKLPVGTTALAGLWVHSDDDKLLDRITQNLSWKLPDRSLIRVHRNLLLINKSGSGIMEKVGLGFSEEYFEMASKADLGIVVRVFNYPGLSADSAYKMINAIPAPASVSALLFADEEMLGARGEINKIVEQFKNRSYRIGWIEFDIQDGIKEYLNGLSENRPFVRVHSISRKEMDLVYSKDRAIARWVRAVKDRSLKMLYFRCFFQDPKKYIANLTDFNLNYLKQTVKELRKAGYIIAKTDEERLHEPRHIVGRLIPAETLAIGIALILGLAVLLKISFVPNFGGFGILLLAFFSVAVFFINAKQFVGLAGVIGAISYSCIGYVLATKLIEKNNFGFLKNSIRFIFSLVLPSLIGGFLIAGIYSNIEYMLKFEQFRGIKLAFVIPLLFTVVWSLRKYGRNVFALLQKPMNIIGAIIIIGVGASLILYILRSGNTTVLKPTAIEDAFRTFLENTLVARPRNKEFLVGYPAALLFVMLFMRKELIFLPLLSLFIQMGQVSVVNTMCHFHTPLKMSLLRVVNGLWLGALVGFAIVLLWRCIQLLVTYGKGKQKRIFMVGYFGFGNAGDELLLDAYTNKLTEALPEYKISALIGRRTPQLSEQKISWVTRRDFTAVIEELIRSEAIVIPGGGVFQSSTSCRSLFYYLSIIILARIFEAKVILPAQGLGPWKNNGFIANMLHKRLAKELSRAEYLSLRDNASFEKLKEISSFDFSAEVTSDLAFLSDKFSPKKVNGKIEFMRICAVIRNSVRGSSRIVADLIKLAQEHENIELIPVSFQPGEDTYAWRKAGWKGDIKSVDDFETVFENADLVISMRLHGCIIATNLGIPWIGLTYDPKVSGFAEKADWKDFSCAPAEANFEFFENCINKLAFDYENYSKKLLDYANKMHKCSEDDFNKSKEAITKTLLMLFLFLVLNSNSVFAQNHFPAWMDEVNFDNQKSKTAFTGPVDPETGKVSTIGSKHGKNFKPNLPDFAELRKKATKVESETDKQIVEETVNSSIQNIADIPELATATKLIGAMKRVASEATEDISKKYLDDEEPDEEELRRRRIYKPGRVKSFYIEMKEAEKKQQENSK